MIRKTTRRLALALLAALCALLLTACGEKPVQPSQPTEPAGSQEETSPGHSLPEQFLPDQSGTELSEVIEENMTFAVDDVRTITVQITPPGETAELPEKACGKFLELLQNVNLLAQDDTGTEVDGRSVAYTVELKTGEKHTFVICTPFVIVDGVGYRSDADSCAMLIEIGDTLIQD